MLKIFGIALLVLAYVLLVPGLTEPMLSVTGTLERAELVELGREFLRESQAQSRTGSIFAGLAEMFVSTINTEGSINAFDETRSILGTAAELRSNGHLPVAVLIVLFSVVVPVVKGLIVLATQFAIVPRWRQRLGAIGNALSKWSMADVFVVAIFIAYLAARGMQADQSLIDFDAALGPGYWYFLGYCLLSILATQILQYSNQLDDKRHGASSDAAHAGKAATALAMAAEIAKASSEKEIPQEAEHDERPSAARNESGPDYADGD